jgi:hypothetical protein
MSQYLTALINPADATNIMINDANADTDAITGLRSPTNFGRPNWDMIFRSIRKLHAPAEAGVFFCGPKPLGSLLRLVWGWSLCGGRRTFSSVEDVFLVIPGVRF